VTKGAEAVTQIRNT
jgi:hypothetical protein